MHLAVVKDAATDRRLDATWAACLAGRPRLCFVDARRVARIPVVGRCHVATLVVADVHRRAAQLRELLSKATVAKSKYCHMECQRVGVGSTSKGRTA